MLQLEYRDLGTTLIEKRRVVDLWLALFLAGQFGQHRLSTNPARKSRAYLTEQSTHNDLNTAFVLLRLVSTMGEVRNIYLGR
jgi:hypothetical protein